MSRLAVHYPERFKAYAFVAAGYTPTSSGLDWETGMRMMKQIVGYETMGYWECVSDVAAICVPVSGLFGNTGSSPKTEETRSSRPT